MERRSGGIISGLRRLTSPAAPRRLRRDQSGATVVEFALVAAPFFALLLAVMETALVFFAGQVLETGAAQSARLIRTGQAQAAGFDEEQFRLDVCGNVAGLFSCTDRLKVDVRTYDQFDGVDLSKPLDEDGNLQDDFVFDPGAGGDIVVVRVFYEWPTIVPHLGVGIGDMANGNLLLASTITFRNEPF